MAPGSPMPDAMHSDPLHMQGLGMGGRVSASGAAPSQPLPGSGMLRMGSGSVGPGGEALGAFAADHHTAATGLGSGGGGALQSGMGWAPSHSGSELSRHNSGGSRHGSQPPSAQAPSVATNGGASATVGGGGAMGPGGTGPAAARSRHGGSGRSAPPPPGANWPPLLQVFRGIMRREVAPLAAAAALRARVTPPLVSPGLYFTEAASANAALGAGGGAADKGRGLKRTGSGGSVAVPLAKWYPEAAQELMALLEGRSSLAGRTHVERITDRCHPCFRNPFVGLSAVPERHKLVAAVDLSEGTLLGPYVGEVRSGKMDERLVGGDLSGVEGLKAAFTLSMLDGLQPPQPPPPPPQPGQAANGKLPAKAPEPPPPDSLVVVGDPALCPLAEANAPRFWGYCGARRGGGDKGGGGFCNCAAYEGRAANAVVLNCILKASAADGVWKRWGRRASRACRVQLSRVRAAAEAAGEGEALRQGLEALRVAAAAAAPGALSSDPCVYAVVPVVVTSVAIKARQEVLLGSGDDDESHFSVADQNLRQYQYIRGVMASKRDTERQRDTAKWERDEAVRLRDEAAARAAEAARRAEQLAAQLAEAKARLTEAEHTQDRLQQQVRDHGATAAAVAAAAGPKVAALELRVSELTAERDALLAGGPEAAAAALQQRAAAQSTARAEELEAVQRQLAEQHQLLEQRARALDERERALEAERQKRSVAADADADGGVAGGSPAGAGGHGAPGVSQPAHKRPRLQGTKAEPQQLAPAAGCSTTRPAGMASKLVARALASARAPAAAGAGATAAAAGAGPGSTGSRASDVALAKYTAAARQQQQAVAVLVSALRRAEQRVAAQARAGSGAAQMAQQQDTTAEAD
ncbi:hypothetical protein HXX76_006720 [Chlamydomonas incerta]|uniref:Uncharacterized protein n=1 Tax=Chlamydomonas incerta TaxID=51695 RepID=A0A835TDV0_CHLIN|nr:hypothetical protein HXX76_006720 [Chlamydomonas incerta]|eukprot:KAG2436416.1 hypothetical protein HXX76_006720 [Chlamydomonas incerta]